MSMEVLSLQIGKIKSHGNKNSKKFSDKYWQSASFKDITHEKVWANKLSLVGDEVADKIHHGGLDKAIFANSYENYEQWANFLNLENIPFGALAENLTITGLHENNVYLGDIHKIGSAILQVSQPRKPCWKISKKWNNEKFTNEIYTSGLTGWYYRVIEEGFIKSGDKISVLSQEETKISILDTNIAFNNINKTVLEKILTIDSIAKSFRISIEKKLEGVYNLDYMNVK